MRYRGEMWLKRLSSKNKKKRRSEQDFCKTKKKKKHIKNLPWANCILILGIYINTIRILPESECSYAFRVRAFATINTFINNKNTNKLCICGIRISIILYVPSLSRITRNVLRDEYVLAKKKHTKNQRVEK